MAEDSIGNVASEVAKSWQDPTYDPNYGRAFMQGIGTGFVEGNLGVRVGKKFDPLNAAGIAVAANPFANALPAYLILDNSE